MASLSSSSAEFPRRAFLQSFDGEISADYRPLQAVLEGRGVEVVALSSEEFLLGQGGPRQFALSRDDLVVGDFQWTRSALRCLQIEMPAPPDYPRCLQKFLHRRIWQSTLGEVAEQLSQGTGVPPLGIFIKPAEDTKVFSAIIEPKDEMIEMLLEGMPGVISALPPTLSVHCAEVVEMVSEYRVYVVGEEIRCIAHYLGPDEGKLDRKVVEEAVQVLADSEEALGGCGMDFAVLRKREENLPDEFVTCLVEVNDGFSLGVYQGLSGADYADMLISRWKQLMMLRQ